jgi:hypothetical protein
MSDYPAHIHSGTGQIDLDPLRRGAWASQEMEAFRESLRIRGLPDIRSAVLDDLSSYFNLEAEACIYRARNSFEPSSKQWLTKDRSTETAIIDFYRHLSPEYALGILCISATIVSPRVERRPGRCAPQSLRCHVRAWFPPDLVDAATRWLYWWKSLVGRI